MSEQVPRLPVWLDPLIAEARRRTRRRRAIALVLSLAVAAATAWVALPSTSVPVVPAVEASSAAIHPIESVGASGGLAWAFDRHGFFWLTLDGGRTWRFTLGRTVKPPGAFGASMVAGVQFVDKRHGWIGIFDGGVKTYRFDPHPWAIERTVDGGRTWRVAWLPGCGCDSGQFTFYDARHGYVLATKPKPSGRSEARLYWTDDGGASWKLVARPPHDGTITFVDRRDGFVATYPGVTSCNGPLGGRCPPPTPGALYRTTDGGKTWSKLRVPPPSTGLGRPISAFGHNLVESDWNGRHPRIYASRDGGAHWSASIPPVPEQSRFAAGSPTMWLLLTYHGGLHVTHDAGQSWQTFVPRGLPRPLAALDLVFSSPRVGWILVGRYGALYRTTDGGRHWKPSACGRRRLACSTAG